MSTKPRIPIHYRKQTPTNLPLGPRTLMFFYPDGEWDGWRRRLETCEDVYPQSEYQWIEMDASIDMSKIMDEQDDLLPFSARKKPILEDA